MECGPRRCSTESTKDGFNLTLIDLSTKSIYFDKSKIGKLCLYAENYICADANYIAISMTVFF